MFYCETCREARGWPESLSRSRGACELCKTNAACWSRPSSTLPMPTFEADELRHDPEYGGTRD